MGTCDLWTFFFVHVKRQTKECGNEVTETSKKVPKVGCS